MVNKRFCLGILVLVLVFGMTVVGCDNGSTGVTADTWTDVTSLSQLNGTWKGSFTQTETEEGITMKMVMEMTMTINASAGTMSGSQKVTITFSGNNLNTYWPFIKEDFATEDGWTINDSTHTVTMTETIPSTSMSMADMEGVQINQNGTMGDDSPELIFTKQ